MTSKIFSISLFVLLISILSGSSLAQAESIIVEDQTVDFEIDGGNVISIELDSDFIELIIGIDTSDDGILEIVYEANEEGKINEFRNALDRKKIQNTEVLCVFIWSQVDNKVINRLSKLKFIATMSTGFDHINLKACKELDIKVSNVPFYGDNTVAEHTFALILSLSRNIHKSYVRTMQGNFSSLTDSFKRTLDRMVSDLLASKLFETMLGSFGETGKLGGLVGKAFGGFRAMGGAVERGSAYVVGEKRAELFVPKVSGTILPNAKETLLWYKSL